jgi:predicted phage tail protein
MATVIVSVATSPVAFPSTTVPAGIVITLSGGIAPQTVTAAPYSASFSDVAPGTYTASAQAVDASGNALGAAAVSAEFTIAAPDVNVDIPSTVTVQVS